MLLTFYGYGTKASVSCLFSLCFVCVVMRRFLYFKFKNMIIEIGNKKLKEMSDKDVRQIIIIEGCCPVISSNGVEIWSEPVIKDFNNTMFHNTHVLGHSSFRISDNIESCYFEFYLNFENFSYHYTRDYEKNRNQKSSGNRLGIESIKYLISKGYDVPLYNVA